MDVLCPTLTLFVQSTCIRRHHLRVQHLSLDISQHNSIRYFLAQPKEPANEKNKKIIRINMLVGMYIEIMILCHTFPKLPFPSTARK